MDDHHQPRKELSVMSPKMIWSQESVLQRIAAVSNKEEEVRDADFQIDNGAGPSSALLVAIKNMKKEKYEEELNPSEIEGGDIAVGGDQIEANIKKKHSVANTSVRIAAKHLPHYSYQNCPPRWEKSSVFSLRQSIQPIQ